MPDSELAAAVNQVRPSHQSRATATRQQIILGAAQTFDATGYDGASLSMIIDRAGVTRGALYFHFKTKEEIGRAVINAQHAASIELVECIAATEVPAIEQVIMLCHAMGRQIVTDPIVRAGIRLTVEQTFTQGDSDPYLGWIAASKTLVQQAIVEGDVAEWVDADELANFIPPAFTGVQLVSHVLTGRQDLHRRIDAMWRYLLPGIVPHDRRDRIPHILSARADTD